MKWISRSDLGWPESAAPEQLTTKGVKIHYLGSPFKADGHADCAAHVKSVRKAHLANEYENYSDIAYNLLVCQHGYVFEGRGKHKRSGANGDQPLNKAHYAICALIGTKGDTVPTDEMIDAIKDAIFYMRKYGAGLEIKGHRDGHATACPGDVLYALVKSGKLEPDKPKPKPVYAPYPGKTFFKLGREHPLIKAMGKRLVAVGYKGYNVGPSEKFERGDIKAYAWWQRKLGYEGSDADGYPGKTSWDALKVAKPQ